MEILMKCTPTTKSSTPTPLTQSAAATLKIVDHHRQLQQHNLNGSPVVQPPAVTPESLCCLECPPPLLAANTAGPPMSCCSSMPIAQAKSLAWDHTASRRQLMDYCASAYEQQQQQQQHGDNTSFYDGRGRTSTPPCCSLGRSTPPTTPQHHLNLTLSDDYVQTYEYREPEENFVSIDDAKIKGFLMQMSRRRFEQDEIKRKSQQEPKKQLTYEIIDLDDEEERQKLKRIKEQAERDLAAKSAASSANRPAAKLVQSGVRAGSCNTASISLIPRRSCATGKERIIAQIDLLDSSSSSGGSEDEDDTAQGARTEQNCASATRARSNRDEENANNAEDDDDHDDEDDDDDDDEEQQLSLAAVAVTCELQCEDDDGQSIQLQQTQQQPQQQEEEEHHDEDENLAQASAHKGKKPTTTTKPPSEDDEYIEDHEEGVELRWDDFEQKERSFFECFLCGKKVQSSYNLRRHMMIHTGERPFACDLCERRFREFSDLKKHRRRHANEPNFLCMVCRSQPPTAGDATRCSNCDTKQSALVASSRPQLSTSPAEPTPTPTKVASTTTATTTKATNQQIAYKPEKSTATSILRKTPKSLSSYSAANAVATATRTPPPLTPVHKTTKSAAATKTPSPPPPPPPPPPPLTPIAASHLLLDSLPAVHRPSYNQMGIVTRKEFPCPLCQRAFGTRHNLKRHFMIHTGEKPFSCPKCRKPFREYSTLKKHMVTHDRDRWYKCTRCPQKFRDYLDFNDHRLSHPEGECSEAMSPTAGSSSSSNTPTLRSKRTRKSTVPGHGYEDSNDTTEEYEDDDEEGDADADDDDEISMDMAWLECCECGLRFTDLDEYTEHLKVHAATILPYECYICKKSFGQHYQLVQHMAVHEVDDVDDDDDESGTYEAETAATRAKQPQRNSKKTSDLKLRAKEGRVGERQEMTEGERESTRPKRRRSGYETQRSRR